MAKKQRVYTPEFRRQMVDLHRAGHHRGYQPRPEGRVDERAPTCAGMPNTIWLVVTALAFGGVVEKVGVLDRLITPIINKAMSDGALAGALSTSIVATNVVTAVQYIARRRFGVRRIPDVQVSWR